MSETVIPWTDDEEVPSTSHIHFLAGSFCVGEWEIPFFTTTMTFSEAAKDLRLTNDMPSSHGESWTVSELYQREIDWARVEGPLLQYLLSSQQPQFFNSLTIALMPYDEQQGTALEAFNSDVAWSTPKLALENNYSKVLSVGPIRFGFYGTWNTVQDTGFLAGKMRWNTNQVYGVAIDGQHRLAAIKEFVKAGQHSKSRVPVIFLLFDPRVGFKGPVGTSTTTMMRRLFIDLNKYAKTVSRARQILLDDRDPISRCVRTLLSDSIRPDFASIELDNPTLPLSLVDWHSENARFDQGPYLATVLGVDWIVSVLLGHKTLTDMTEYSKISKQISSLEFRLDVNLTSAKARLHDCELTLTPFSFTDSDLDDVSEGFRRTWNQAVVTLFANFLPYKDLIRLRENEEHESVSNEWQMWFKLREAATNQASHAMEEMRRYSNILHHSDPPISDAALENALTEIEKYKSGNLAFNVVFQRSYFQAFKSFFDFTDLDLSQIDDWINSDEIFLDEDDQAVINDEDSSMTSLTISDDLPSELATVSPNRATSRALEFVSLMNTIVTKVPDFLDLSAKVDQDDKNFLDLWAGTLRKSGGEIDFTKAAGERGGDLVYVCVAMALVSKKASGTDVDFDDFWVEVVDSSDWEPFKKIAWAVKRLFNGSSSMGGRIINEREDEYDPFVAKLEVENRLKAIWKLLCQPD